MWNWLVSGGKAKPAPPGPWQPKQTLWYKLKPICSGVAPSCGTRSSFTIFGLSLPVKPKILTRNGPPTRSGRVIPAEFNLGPADLGSDVLRAVNRITDQPAVESALHIDAV